MAAPVIVVPGHPAWRDGKRYMWLTATVVPLTAIVGYGLWHRTGVGLHWWITPLFVFVLVPLLDLTSPPDPVNPPEQARAALEADRYYRHCTYLYLPLAGIALVLGTIAWAGGNLSVLARLGAVISVGTATGVGITTAHELGHRRGRLERGLARLMLAASGYGHFLVEHNRGHHVRVATPEDPASARLGEGFWRFWPRTVFGGLRSAWALEAGRLRRHGRRVVSARNEVLRGWLLTAALFGTLAGVLGVGVLVFLAAQALVGVTLLEGVNYIEHYGLARARTPTGRYEPVTPAHSWNSDAVISNLALYQLQRHSDHHAHPTRRYQTLRSFAESPQLPGGYATLLIVAFLPPWWFRLMDGRVLAHYGGDLARAHGDPARTRKLTDRYRA
ncbi:Alkane 1-monooxygenase [Frankia sp. AiPs1]|uniref:alkane 1-monooxygenase n=1 Tax=Frankia sp. AiPa1 TaxID=573492 RepID=UPI00202B40DE|nr:alkane 1-monooxygenase [Frankia sp. AiPa1]MCL9761756.1 alkane 1-monooxygenase [Frankia sp. AiPa1]